MIFCHFRKKISLGWKDFSMFKMRSVPYIDIYLIFNGGVKFRFKHDGYDKIA